MGICSHLLNKFLTKQLIFCALICASKQIENTVKKKITHVASLFRFFEKVFAVFNFFTAHCLGFRFWGLCCFICLKFNPRYWYLLFPREKMCWFRSYFQQGKGRNLQKLCLHKIFGIGSTTKVNFHEFCVFILDLKCAELQYC